MVSGGTLISSYGHTGFGSHYSDGEGSTEHYIGSLLTDLSIRYVKKITQSEYDALTTKQDYVLYIIVDD